MRDDDDRVAFEEYSSHRVVVLEIILMPRRGKATSTTNPMKVFTVFASRKDTPPPFTTKAATKTTRLNAVLEPEQQRQQNNGDNINAEKMPLQGKGVKRLTKSEREKNSKDYEWAALISSCGVTSIAITATYFRLLRSYNLMDDVGGVSVFRRRSYSRSWR